MLKRLFEVLEGRHPPDINKSEDDTKLAVAALMVEAARMDQNFDDRERSKIAALLAGKFELSGDETESLIGKADKKISDTDQNFPFTHAINMNMDGGERVYVIEMLWSVAYADGQLDPYEDALIRQIAGLIYVSDRDRMLARKRALEKLGIA